MNATLQTAPFTIGTSSSVAMATNGGLVDMSLDELIKARRTETAQVKKVHAAAAAEKQRTNVKAKTKQNTKKPTIVQKSVGAGKAKRNAKTAAKRGLVNSPKATPMQVEREIYRQQRTGGKKNGGNNNPGQGGRAQTRGTTTPRRSEKAKANSARSEAEMKVKARKALEAKKKVQAATKKAQEAAKKKGAQKKVNPASATNGNKKMNGQKAPAPPTKKAVKAAMTALKSAGFSAPKGLKMVVSFVNDEAKLKKTQQQVKKTQNQNKNDKQVKRRTR